MSNKIFRFLVGLMSLSLIGVIFVQVYWVRIVVHNNKSQFSLNVEHVLSKVAEDLDQLEMQDYLNRYYYLKDSLGIAPQEEEFIKFAFYQFDSRTKEAIIYKNSIIGDNATINSNFYDPQIENYKVKNFKSLRQTQIFKEKNDFENKTLNLDPEADVTITKSGQLDILDKAQYEIFFRDIAAIKPIEYRVRGDVIEKLLNSEFSEKGIKTNYEYAVTTKKDRITEVKSSNFARLGENTFQVKLFKDNEKNSDNYLEVSFPSQREYLYSEIRSTMILSILFTIVIILVFVSTINQFLKQRQISQIKTDFINNMTHEFKTPIATINLALDSVRNPKIFENPESMRRYLGVIREENKRMNAQVENVLRISKLDKREITIEKEPVDIHDLIEDAADHVSLLLDESGGKLVINNNATRSTVLANDTHFTNVLVNIMENAIKYSPQAPEITVETENIKDLILIKVKDKGIGISKSAQKKIFDKFYREHTGDIHNVKGHGLGLAYVKRIIDAHNGEIFVESEKGEGSTFIIKLSLIIN